jgi:hypothetical protein
MSKKATLKSTEKQAESSKFMFGKLNYMFMLAGMVVIIIGFMLMSGTEDIYNTTKLTLAPITVMIGFVIELVAIMYRPKKAE